MNNVILTKDSDSVSIKSYFQGVLALSEKQEEFPVNLDDVWPLVYAYKHKAVSSLKTDFIQDIDYQVFTQKGENPNGGRPVESYHLSISCLEYFIARKVRPVFEVYRQVFHKALSQPVLPQDYISALKALVKSEEEKLIAQSRLAETQPKAEYCDKVLTSSSAMTTTQIAKEYGMSAVKFNKLLSSLKIQFKQSGQWQLYKPYDNCGYTETSTVAFDKKDGGVGTTILTKWTQKGRKFLYEFLNKKDILRVSEQNDLIL